MAPARLVIAVLVLLGGGPSRLAAQFGLIRGQVVRADYPVGLADADVVLRPSGAATRTDARGSFAFRQVASGPVELAVRRLGFAPVVVAVEVSEIEPTEIMIRLAPVAAILDPVVTSATRDARSLSQVPASVSVADTSTLGRDRDVGLHEVLKTMPGVQVASRYGSDDVNIGIRGSSARARQAVRGVAVLLDGIPLTEPDGVARLDLIELAATRQVEVVRGPVSALYAGSPSGVVNVVSRTGRDSRGISARASGGAFGFRKYEGHAGGVFAGGRTSGFVAASHTSADGYRAHSDSEILRGQGTFDYVAGPGTRVVVEAHGSRLDSRLPSSLNQVHFDADPDAAAPIAETFGFGRVDNRYRGGARLEQAVGGGVASGYAFYGGRTLTFPIPTEITDLNLHRVQGGTRLRADGVAGTTVAATVGVDYDNVFGDDRRWENRQGVRGSLHDDGHFSVPNIGAYSQVEWQAADPVEMTLGLRYDRVTYRFESVTPGNLPRKETTFDQLSPRLSAAWRPHTGTSLYASVGRGFEVPAINELSASPGDTFFVTRPKSLWNYEVGGRRLVRGRVLLEGSVFYGDVRGEFVPRAANNSTLPENASRSRNIGFELGLAAHAGRQVEVAATYTFLDLRLRDYSSAVLDSTGRLQERDFAGKLLPAVPRHRVTGQARLRGPGALDLGVRVEWQSVVYVETGNADAGIWCFRPGPGAPVQQVAFRAVPSRAVAHLDAAWRLGPATVFGSVENLFGLRYAGNVVANEISGRFYEAGSPTWVSLGLRVVGWNGLPRRAP
jgi:iron complex outermembrane recepter protein